MFDYLDEALYWVREAVAQIPWARGGLLIAALVAVALAVPVAKLLRSNPIIVGCLIGTFGAVLVFTLTPGQTIAGPVDSCYLQFGKPTRADLVRPTDVSLNLLMLFPLGVLLTWLRPWIAVCGAFLVALALPVAIEFTQYALARLGRACSFYDIQTNITGLLAGVAVGLVIRLLWVIGVKFIGLFRR